MRLLLVVLLLVCIGWTRSQAPNEYDDVVQWAVLSLRMIQQSGPYISPPLVARALAIHTTCIYDAWATYSTKAVPVFSNGLMRRSGSRQEVATAIAYASLRALEYIFEPRPLIVGNLTLVYRQAGYDTNYRALDSNTAAGVGNIACKAVMDYRKNDGANSNLDRFSSIVGGNVYSDWTNYYPVNPVQPTAGYTDCSQVRDINKWQPLLVPSRTGTPVQQVFATPHMAFVTPFAVKPFEFVGQFQGPGYLGSSSDRSFREQISEVLEISGQLDDRLKVIAEFWADGPNSAFPPGHWHEIVIETIRNEKLSLEGAVKLLFLQGNAVFDGGVLSWALKLLWNSGRPITIIQCLYQNQTVTAWRGPYLGAGPIEGAKWQPYQSVYFITPPFSEYVSGHSTFSAASAGILRRFFGDDKFRANSYTVAEGKSLFEPKIERGQPGYIEGVTDVPNRGPNTVGYVPAREISLSWETWTEAAEEAGASRLYGGIHFKAGNEDGLKLGELIAEKVWTVANRFFKGGLRRQFRNNKHN